MSVGHIVRRTLCLDSRWSTVRLSHGKVSVGVVSDGVVSDGVVSDGVLSDERICHYLRWKINVFVQFSDASLLLDIAIRSWKSLVAIR